METKRKHRYRIKNFLPLTLIAVLIVLAAVLLVAILSRGPEYRPQTQEEISDILELNAGLPLSDRQKSLVDAAVSLVGRVPYFWGGKSEIIGFDERWNTPMTVTSEGSDSTGGTEPYGLDCSGYVSWCFIQTGLSPAEMNELIGHGTWNQWDKSAEISWNELRIGDIVFIRQYPTDEGNHIGICIGFDKKGNPYFAHCSATYDSVVVTPAGDAFRYARRPSECE